MHSHKVYVVAVTEQSRDVRIVNVYDGDVYTVDSIACGLKDKLGGSWHVGSMIGDNDNAYIDIVDSKDELIKTYSIISKVAMLVND